MPRRRTYVRPGQQEVASLHPRTVSGNSATTTAWALTPGSPQCRLTITAASGTTPSMTLTVEDSSDGVTWTARDTFPAQTTTATVTRALPTTLAPLQRVAWAITGTTPSFTFNVQFAATAAQLV